MDELNNLWRMRWGYRGDAEVMARKEAVRNAVAITIFPWRVLLMCEGRDGLKDAGGA